LGPDPADEYPGEGFAIAGSAADDLHAGSGDERRGERRRRPGAASPGGADPHDPGTSGGIGAEGGGSEEAQAICLRLLTAGPRTRAQLATAMRKQRIADEVAESVLGQLAEAGMIDDAEPISEEAAREICLRLLTAGPRTRAQLATALRKRKIPGEVAESVLSRFAEVGLIDDAAFARAWVESRHYSRGLARRALTAELRQRGIPDGEVRSAVSLLGPQDELATAQRLVAKRLPATRGKPAPARARQLMGMLARKGYPAGLAAQVVREALEQEQADSEGDRADLAWISEDGAGDDWP
jgi:regulatory protein